MAQRDRELFRYRILSVIDRRGSALHGVIVENLRVDPQKLIRELEAMAREDGALVVQTGERGPWRLTENGRELLSSYRSDAALAREGAVDATEGALSIAERVSRVRRDRDVALDVSDREIAKLTADVEEAERILSAAHGALEERKKLRARQIESFDTQHDQIMADLRALVS